VIRKQAQHSFLSKSTGR